MNEFWFADLMPFRQKFTTCALHIIQQVPYRRLDRSMGLTAASCAPLLLWTILRWERKIGLVAVEQAGIDLHALEKAVDGALRDLARERPGRGIDDAGVEALRGLVDEANQEAAALQHDWIGSEHLLLALLSRDRTRGLPWLATFNLEYRAVRTAIQAFLAHPFDASSP
jgi:ATP-dependent Clp protease ATP-binding subunit ClpA